MTVTEFESFKNVLFTNLKKENSKALEIIDENEKLIKFYLNGDDQALIKKFVTDFNNVILDKNVKYDNYKLFESVLNHRLFTKVLNQFRESDILIRACADVKMFYIYVHSKVSILNILILNILIY